jgi:hypothetical protein
MRAFKKFAIEPVDVILYGDVTNLLNKKNILDVFSATGRPDYTTNPNASPENQHRPQWYGASRHVELGLEVGF